MAYQKRCTMSLYIPMVFNHTPTSDIERIFELLEIGKVTKVDRLPVMREELDEEGNVQRKRTHDQVFVHLVWRTDSVAAMNLYDKLEVEGQSAKLVYNDPYYWAVYKNRNPEQSVIREQGARIQVLETQVAELTKRVEALETSPDWEEQWDQFVPTGQKTWTRAVTSPLWQAHEHPRGIKGIDSLEPWEGDDGPEPDPDFHNPFSPNQSPTQSPQASPASEELRC